MRIAYCEPNTLKSPTPCDAADRILQVRDQVVGDVGAGRPVRLVVDRHDQQEVRIRLRDHQPLLLHRLRQPRQRLLHLVLHLHLRDVGVGALVEGERDRGAAIGAGTRREIDEPVDAGELLLDDLRDAGFQCLRRRARVVSPDVDRGRRDVGILLHRQQADAGQAAQHDEDGDHPCQHRPVDEYPRDHQSASEPVEPPMGVAVARFDRHRLHLLPGLEAAQPFDHQPIAGREAARHQPLIANGGLGGDLAHLGARIIA